MRVLSLLAAVVILVVGVLGGRNALFHLQAEILCSAYPPEPGLVACAAVDRWSAPSAVVALLVGAALLAGVVAVITGRLPAWSSLVVFPAFVVYVTLLAAWIDVPISSEGGCLGDGEGGCLQPISPPRGVMIRAAAGALVAGLLVTAASLLRAQIDGIGGQRTTR